MTLTLRLLLSPVLSLSSCLTLIAGQSEGSNKMVTIMIEVKVYRCLKPPEQADCVAPSEREKSDRCPKCTEWKEEYVRSLASIVIDPDAFSYDTGAPRANFFVDDVARQIYGTGLPETSSGHPIVLRDLYSNPEKYGWMEVAPDQLKRGTIAVWPSIAGVVVEDSSSVQPKGTQATAHIEVLYPSDKLGGKLNQADAKYLGEGEKPKFLIPGEVLTKHNAPAKP